MKNKKVELIFSTMKGFSVSFLIIGLAIFASVYFSSSSKKANADGVIVSSSRTITSSDLGKDVVVNSGVTFTIVPLSSGAPNHLKSLDIKSGGIVTHPKPTSNNYTSSDIDLLLDVDLVMEGTAKIDVSGLGYLGTDLKVKGDGPGGGVPAPDFEYGGGGGAYGGMGRGYVGCGGGHCQGTKRPGNTQSQPYGSAESPTDLGSGGSGSGNWTCDVWGCDGSKTNGASGGGRVKIVANVIAMSPNSQILANGNPGSVDKASSGGGSGGSIWLVANKTFYTISSGNPSVSANNVHSGGDWAGLSATDGSFVGTPNQRYGSNIQAKGGQYGGSGGRISISGIVENPFTKTSVVLSRQPNGSFVPKAQTDRNARQDDRIKYTIKYNYKYAAVVNQKGYPLPVIQTKSPDGTNDVVIVTEYSATNRPCPSGYSVTNSFDVGARADGQAQIIATCTKGNAKAEVVAGSTCPAGYDDPNYKYTTDSRSSGQMTSCVASGSSVAIRFIGEYVAGDPVRGCPTNYTAIYTSELSGNATATCRKYL